MNDLPRSWAICSLGDVLLNAKPGFASGQNIEDGTIQVRMNNVTTEGTFDWSRIRRVPEPTSGINGFSLLSGDVLFNHTNSPELVGKCAAFQGHDEVVTFSNHFLRLRPNKNLLDNRYLMRWLNLQWQRGRFAGMCKQWVNQATVSRDLLLALQLPLPPLGEQRRIAAILDAADALRQKRRQALRLLDQLTQAIFVEMFGDPTTNPKAWPTAELGALLVDGPQNGLYKPARAYGAGTKILRIDAFYDGRVTKLAELKRLMTSEAELKVYGLDENDIVINRVNSTEYLGKSAIIPKLDEPVVFESNMMRFRVNEEHVLPGYIIQYLQTPHIKAQIRTSTKDAVNQSSINQTDVKSFMVRVPPLKLQSKFVAACDKARSLMRSLGAGNDRLAELFASLQHRAFRGEL